jgi:RHS repeat-associated protein
VLDESGGVLDQIAYDAFGNIVAQLNPLVDNPLLFTSRSSTPRRAVLQPPRYLDPTTGRWTTPDPLGFAAGDANLYRYVGNTPTLATDPSGNIAWFVAVPLVMSVGGFTWLTGSYGFGLLSHDRQLVGCRHLGSLLGWAASGNPSQCQRAGQCGSLAADAGGVE